MGTIEAGLGIVLSIRFQSYWNLWDQKIEICHKAMTAPLMPTAPGCADFTPMPSAPSNAIVPLQLTHSRATRSCFAFQHTQQCKQCTPMMRIENPLYHQASPTLEQHFD